MTDDTIEVRSTWNDRTADSDTQSVTTPKKSGAQQEYKRARMSPTMARDLKIMIENALADAGGEQYLRRQAEDNPTAFMALVGKLLPRDVSVKTDISLNVRHELIEKAVASLMGRDPEPIDTPALPHKSAVY